MEKVAFWRVIGNTWMMLWEEARTLLLFMMFAFCIQKIPAFFSWLTGNTSEDLPRILISVLVLFLILAWSLLVARFVVSRTRQQTSYLPKQVFTVLVQSFGVLVPICALIVIVGFVCSMPIFGVIAADLGADHGILNFVLYMLTGGFAVISVLAIYTRMLPVLYGIVMEEAWGVKRSWRMSKGYTGRMCLVMCMIYLPILIVVGLASVLLGGETTAFLGLLLNFMISAASVIEIVFFGILYNNLNEQYDMMNRPDSDAFVIETPVSS